MIRAPLKSSELQAIKSTVWLARSSGMSDTVLDAHLQRIVTGEIEPDAFVIADMRECFRCGGACGPIQCSEGAKVAA